MTSITNLKQINWDRQNEEAYDELVVSLEASSGELNLLIGVCDNSDFREQIIRRYEKELQSELRCYRVTLPQKEPSLRAAIAELVQKEEYLQQKGKAVITVTGVEKLSFLKGKEKRSEQEKFLGYLQWTREALRDFPYSIILWITRSMEAILSKKAPDFWSWRKGVFRFISRQNNFISFEKVVPIFSSFEELSTKNNVPLFSLENLTSLIKQIELTQGKHDFRLATLYASLGQIYKNRLEQNRFQNYQKELDLAIECYCKAIKLQKELNLELDLATSINNLAKLYSFQGKFKEAKILYQQALELFQQIGDALGEAVSYNNLGNIYDFLGQYREAIDYHKQALAKFQKLGDKQGEASSYSSLGNAFHPLGQYQEAINYYQQALAILEQIDDVHGKAIVYNSLGNAYNSLGDYQQAIIYFVESLTIFKQMGDKQGEASSYGNLGDVYDSLEQYQKAIDYLEQSLVISIQIRYIQGEAKAYNGLGNAYNSLKEYQKAINYHKQALEIFRQIRHRQGEASSYGNLGNVYNSLGQYQEAINYYQQSLTIKQQIGDVLGEASSYNNLGNSYYSLERYEEAKAFYQQALYIAVQTLGEDHPYTQMIHENWKAINDIKKEKSVKD